MALATSLFNGECQDKIQLLAIQSYIVEVYTSLCYRIQQVNLDGGCGYFHYSH